jgi:hypothetical protein
MERSCECGNEPLGSGKLLHNLASIFIEGIEI